MREEYQEPAFLFNPNRNPMTGECAIRSTIIEADNEIKSYNQDFVVLRAPAEIADHVVYVAISPAISPYECETLLRLYRHQFNVRGGVLQHINDYPRKHFSLMFLSRHTLLLLFYDEPKFEGVEHIIDTISHITSQELSGYYPVWDGLTLKGAQKIEDRHQDAMEDYLKKRQLEMTLASSPTTLEVNDGTHIREP